MNLELILSLETQITLWMELLIMRCLDLLSPMVNAFPSEIQGFKSLSMKVLVESANLLDSALLDLFSDFGCS